MEGSRRPQRGVALLLFLFLLFGIGTATALAALNSTRARLEQERQTQLALQQAKEALIGNAAANATLPGRLLCPERLSVTSPIEGQAQSSCTTTATRIGRFPWKSLRLEQLADGTGEPLWYAISPGFSSLPINSNTSGQLQVDGLPNAAVAIIIAPGPPLTGQSRTPVGPTTLPQASDYLDLGNAGGSAFVSTGPTFTFNDRIAVITQSDLFKAVNTRVLAELRGLDDQGINLPNRGLRSYYNEKGMFPWADGNSDGLADLNVTSGKLPYNDPDLILDSWLGDNGWPALTNYTRLSVKSAQISIGSSTLKVVPCQALPCP